MKLLNPSKVDFHLHTTASDGIINPCQLLQMAQNEKLDVIAITDHDTLAGSKEAIQNSHLFSGIIIPGVEINVDAPISCQMEILGYDIDLEDLDLIQLFQDMRISRYNRGKQIVEKLQSLGVSIFWEDVLKIQPHGVIGRPHIAQALIQQGNCDTLQDAFDKYLERGKPGYVSRFKLSAVEIIKKIHNANGIAILAHPFLSYENLDDFQQNLKILLESGLDGVELFYNYSHYLENKPHKRADFQKAMLYLEMLVKERNLITTGGTDWHGDPNTKIGSINIPEIKINKFLFRIGFQDISD